MNVLFLCTGNSARSIVGEVLFNSFFADQGKAFSAGSKPTGQVNPLALKILEKRNHDVSYAHSQHCMEYAEDGAPQIDLVISVCSNAEKECAIWPGKGSPERLHWPLPDPETEEDFELVYAALKKKLSDYYS